MIHRISLSILMICLCMIFLITDSHAQLSWVTTNPLPTAKRNNALVSRGNTVYSIGGRPSSIFSSASASRDIYRGVAAANGTLSWVTETNILPEALADEGVAINGNKLYLNRRDEHEGWHYLNLDSYCSLHITNKNDSI